MKKSKIIISALAALAVVSSSTVGAMAAQTTGVIRSGVSFAPKDFSLKVSIDKNKIVKSSGKQFKLNAKTNDDSYDVTYYSSDLKVASVTSGGIVRLRKKGKAKIVAECNGVKKVCAVEVKKPKKRTVDKESENKTAGKLELNEKTMTKIASGIGWQTQHAYPSSTIMCSAYSFAYAYYQVTGIMKPAGCFWTSGGCNWAGGTYHRYSSSSEMLSAIKAQIDSGKACVGYLSTGSSSTHYVTFYGYTGSGANLSDYKILDPWDGNLTTGAGYGYCSAGYHVVTVNT